MLQGSLAKRQEEVASIQGIDIVTTFESDVFSGVAVETEEFNIDTLGTFPGVVNVWLNEDIALPPFEEHGSQDGGSMNYTTHISTGVSKLHEMGIYGKGVKVGVIDTGILYDHRAVSDRNDLQAILGASNLQAHSSVRVSALASRSPMAMTLLVMAVCTPVSPNVASFLTSHRLAHHTYCS